MLVKYTSITLMLNAARINDLNFTYPWNRRLDHIRNNA